MALPLFAARDADEAARKRGAEEPLALDEAAFDAIGPWLDRMTDPATGRTGCRTRGGRPSRPGDLATRFPPERSESTTAAALVLRAFLGESARDGEAMRKGLALLAARPPRWRPDDGSIDPVHWTFGTLATFQAGGPAWKTWSLALKQAVVDHQRGDGKAGGDAGSWDPLGPWSADGGRVVTTALLAMVLEYYHRDVEVFGVR